MSSPSASSGSLGIPLESNDSRQLTPEYDPVAAQRNAYEALAPPQWDAEAWDFNAWAEDDDYGSSGDDDDDVGVDPQICTTSTRAPTGSRLGVDVLSRCIRF
jgi:hypothetical protein